MTIEVIIFLTTIPMYIYGKRFRTWTKISYVEEDENEEGSDFVSKDGTFMRYRRNAGGLEIARTHS
jgi:hypothetical protein